MDARLVPLAALQHFAFCPRQCALIHNEQIWSENWLTAQGKALHERVDGGEPEVRKGVRFERGVLVSAPSLGIMGKLDLIEVDTTTGKVTPVEYKRGKPKKDSCDEVQLCAQALCLEEMTETQIEYGALWYWQTRHREKIQFSAELRERTLAVVQQVKDIFTSGRTPEAKYGDSCKACSLFDFCQPQLLQSDKSVHYVMRLFQEVPDA